MNFLKHNHPWLDSQVLLNAMQASVQRRSLVLAQVVMSIYELLSTVPEAREVELFNRTINVARGGKHRWLAQRGNLLHVVRWEPDLDSDRPLCSLDYRKVETPADGKIPHRVFQYGDSRDEGFVVSFVVQWTRDASGQCDGGYAVHVPDMPDLRTDPLFAFMQTLIDLREALGMPGVPPEVADLLDSPFQKSAEGMHEFFENPDPSEAYEILGNISRHLPLSSR
tara:strand:- start:32 stop:703 length:672 start_codon:yes stop_codon:yes gene_type:complete